MNNNKETMKLKPLAKVKTGVWVNREKLRRVLSSLTLIYTLIFLFMGANAFIYERYGTGIVYILLGFPCYLIQFSLYKWRKTQ